MPKNTQFDVSIGPTIAVNMKFSFAAAWENKICVYDNEGNLIIERDNRHIGNADANFSTNQTDSNIKYYVKSYHKEVEDGHHPWIDNWGNMYEPDGDGTITKIGFQDQDHGDTFENAVLLFTYS